MKRNYVITIARSFGSGGRTIGTLLSERLDIPCYERQILAMASDKSGIDEHLFVDADERRNGSLISRKLKTMPFSSVIDAKEKEFTSDNNLFNIQKDIIIKLAKTESYIVIGKCADFVLRPYDHVISVFVDASKEFCIQNIMERSNVSEQRAETLYKKINKYRSEYYNYYTFGKEWKDPLNYDIYLNSGEIGFQDCAEIIADYAKRRFGD